VEFSVGRGAVRIYHLDSEGELTPVALHQHPDLLMPAAPAMQRRWGEGV